MAGAFGATGGALAQAVLIAAIVMGTNKRVILISEISLCRLSVVGCRLPYLAPF